MTARFLGFFAGGVAAGALITVQSVLNAVLGKRAGNLGSVLVLTVVSIAVLVPLVLLFPATANFQRLPGISEWYLYAGGVLGIVILAAPIVLVPRIGATATVTGLVVGQLVLAIAVDRIGLFGFPRVDITAAKFAGLVLLIAGTILIVRR